MNRHPLSALIASALLVVAVGCDKQPQRTDDQAPAEAGVDEREQPASDDEQPASDDAQEPAEEEASACPEPADYGGMCAMVITWALDPDTGTCCEYASPCGAPKDWQTFGNEADCVQAAGQASDSSD
jgi:hypothetical protein